MQRLRLALVVVAMSGCYSAHKATKQVGKALLHHPEIVATIARGAFPCTVVKVDTIINDRLITIDCPATVYDSVVIRGRDTVRTTATKFLKVPYSLPQITIYKSIEDSAKIKLLQDQIYRLTVNEKLLTYKLERRGKYIAALLVAFVISVLINIIKFK